MNVSDLPQGISILREERLKAENRLMGVKEMLASSWILRKVICGNPNCKCQEGKLHGPYPYLSEKRKTHLTYIRKRDLEEEVLLFSPTFTSYRSSAKIESS